MVADFLLELMEVFIKTITIIGSIFAVLVMAIYLIRGDK